MSSDSGFTTPLVLSIVSLGATIITTLVGAYITYYSDERKARRDANKILLKYRDPLLLAAADLQARCFGICDSKNDLLCFRDKDKPGETIYHDTLYIYTAYVVGQYLSWTWILRRQAQFTALVSSSPPRWSLSTRKGAQSTSSLMQKIEDVRSAFNHDELPKERAFMLFKADQQAIGEIMSCQDTNGEYYCLGYATFVDRWKAGHPGNIDQETQEHNAAKVADSDHIGERMAGVSKVSDQSFRKHFKSIEDGIDHMYDARAEYRRRHSGATSNDGSDGRLRRLQHLLLDLMSHLDTSNTMANREEASPIRPAAPDCTCSLHPCHCKPSCKDCVRNKRFALTITGKIRKCPCADQGCHIRCQCKHCRKEGAQRPPRQEAETVYGKDSGYRSPDRDAAAGATRRIKDDYARGAEAV